MSGAPPFRYINHRGIVYFLHAKDLPLANGPYRLYYFRRDVVPDEAVAALPPDSRVVEARGSREPRLTLAPPEEDVLLEQWEEHVPPELRSTYEMVQCAFAGPPPEEAYWSLIELLGRRLPFRALADILCVLFDRDWPIAFNDALIKDGTVAPREQFEAVRERLRQCGYDEWLKRP